VTNPVFNCPCSILNGGLMSKKKKFNHNRYHFQEPKPKKRQSLMEQIQAIRHNEKHRTWKNEMINYKAVVR